MRDAAAVRPYQEDDFDALVALLGARSAPERSVTRSGVRWFLSTPGYSPARDLFVATSADGTRLWGARDVRVTARGDEEIPILESWGAIHPDAPSPDTASALLRAALARAGILLVDRGQPRGIVQARCGQDDASARATFEAAGLTYVRDLVTMHRRSLDDIAEPVFPAGVTPRGYRTGDDDAAWVEAFNAAFAGHWGGFMGMSAARWAHERCEVAFKPEISLVAWDGDRLVGFCHCRIDDELNALRGQRAGMIRYVGVDPAWRRQGLGAALTLAGLHTLRDAGMESAVLGVDAENVTGARRLYERFGFQVVEQQVMYRAEVTAVPEAARRTTP